jgi:hypothetical protein
MEKNTAQVMGMIWILILTYQRIKKEDQVKWAKGLLGNIEGINISNDLASSFQDGMAFAYLIRSFKPEAIDIEEVRKMEIPQRLETTFDKAEKHLGIPRLLEPADCFPEKPNENSMMTYLSFFHNVSRVESGEIQNMDDVVMTPSKPTLDLPVPASPSSSNLTPVKLDFAEVEELRKQVAALTPLKFVVLKIHRAADLF